MSKIAYTIVAVIAIVALLLQAFLIAMDIYHVFHPAAPTSIYTSQQTAIRMLLLAVFCLVMAIILYFIKA